jgi:hypothetical protein
MSNQLDNEIKLIEKQKKANAYLKKEQLSKDDIDDTLEYIDDIWAKRIDNSIDIPSEQQLILDNKFNWDLMISLKEVRSNPRLKILLLLLKTHSENFRQDIQSNVGVSNLYNSSIMYPGDRLFGELVERVKSQRISGLPRSSTIRQSINVGGFAPGSGEIEWIGRVWSKKNGNVKDSLYYINESIKLLNISDGTMNKSKIFTESFSEMGTPDIMISRIFQRLNTLFSEAIEIDKEAFIFVMIGLTLFIPTKSGFDFSTQYEWVTNDILDIFTRKWAGIDQFDATTIPSRTDDTLYALTETANELSKSYQSSSLGGRKNKNTPSREQWLGQASTNTQWNTVTRLVDIINDDLNTVTTDPRDVDINKLRNRISFFIQNNSRKPICYICGGKFMNNDKSSEIEHILPFAQALAYTTLAPTWNEMSKMIEDKDAKKRIEWAKDKFGFFSKCLSEYALAHKCCNRVKSDNTWIDFRNKKVSGRLNVTLQKIHEQLIFGVLSNSPSRRTKPNIRFMNICSGEFDRPNNINNKLRNRPRWEINRMNSIKSNYLDYIINDSKQVNVFSISGLSNLSRVSKQCINKLNGIQQIIIALKNEDVDVDEFFAEPISISEFLSNAPVIVPDFSDKKVVNIFRDYISRTIFEKWDRQDPSVEREHFEITKIVYSANDFNGLVVKYLNSKGIYNIQITIPTVLTYLNKIISDMRGIMKRIDLFFRIYKYMSTDPGYNIKKSNVLRVITQIYENVRNRLERNVLTFLVEFYMERIIFKKEMFYDITEEEDIFVDTMEDDIDVYSMIEMNVVKK